MALRSTNKDGYESVFSMLPCLRLFDNGVMMFQWTFDLTPHLKRKDMTAEQKAFQPC